MKVRQVGQGFALFLFHALAMLRLILRPVFSRLDCHIRNNDWSLCMTSAKSLLLASAALLLVDL